MNSVNWVANVCIQQAQHFGYTKFYNVCNGVGDWITVPWGAVDWTKFAVMGGFTLAIVAAVATLFATVAVCAYKEFRYV